MSDDCHQAPTPRQGIGIARQSQFDPDAFERAVSDLLRACGVSPDGPHTGLTVTRVRELWQQRLLGGYDLDPAEALGEAGCEVLLVGPGALPAQAVGRIEIGHGTHSNMGSIP